MESSILRCFLSQMVRKFLSLYPLPFLPPSCAGSVAGVVGAFAGAQLSGRTGPAGAGLSFLPFVTAPACAVASAAVAAGCAALGLGPGATLRACAAADAALALAVAVATALL